MTRVQPRRNRTLWSPSRWDLEVKPEETVGCQAGEGGGRGETVLGGWLPGARGVRCGDLTGSEVTTV